MTAHDRLRVRVNEELVLDAGTCEEVSGADGCTYVPGSDLDILIVLDRSDRPVRDRIPLYMPGAFPVGVDLFPYTRDEIAARADSPVVAAARRSRWRYVRPQGLS